MKLITKRDVIRSVADRWFAQYDREIERGDMPLDLPIPVTSGDVIATRSDQVRPSAILARLRALDLEACSELDVHNVIRSTSNWCELTCSECGAAAEALAQLERPGELGPISFRLCGLCVLQAFKLLEQYR